MKQITNSIMLILIMSIFVYAENIYEIEEFKKHKYYCDNNIMESCDKLASAYQTGTGTEVNPQKSIYFYNKACNAGYKMSCSMLSLIYEDGVIVKKNLKKAKKYREKAGNFFEKDTKFTKKEIQNKYILAKKDCLVNKISKRCVDLGYIYSTETFSKKNYTIAKKLYELACYDKVAEGCYALSSLYREGKGMKQDKIKEEIYYDKYFSLIKQNCSNKKLNACKELGDIYMDQHKYKKALKYLGKACNGGYTPACRDYERFKR